MGRRPERVAEAIRRLVSEIIRGELKDPRIVGLVTITKVEVTPDLRLAKIHYSVLGTEKEKKKISKGLLSAKNFIRGKIGDELKLRYTPEVMFKIDKEFEYAKNIDNILNKLHREREDDANRQMDEGQKE